MKIQDATATSKEFTRGPALVPTAELLVWLDATRSDIGQRRVRLPVWLELKGPAITSARIGAADGADVVKLKIRDGAMGISVVDRARRASRDGAPAAMWLEGLWEGAGTFSVLKFVKVITPAEADAATFVELEPAP